MTFKEMIEKRLGRIRRVQIVCYVVLVLAFCGNLYSMTMSGNHSPLLLIAMALCCLGLGCCYWGVSRMSCPHCHAKIGYLFRNPYYKKSHDVLYGKGIPKDIDRCPYCHEEWSRPSS